VRGKPYSPLAKPEGESPHRQGKGEKTKGGVNAAAAVPAPRGPRHALGTHAQRGRGRGRRGDGEANEDEDEETRMRTRTRTSAVAAATAPPSGAHGTRWAHTR